MSVIEHSSDDEPARVYVERLIGRGPEATCLANEIERLQVDVVRLTDQFAGAVEENARLREAVRVYLNENGRVRELCEAFELPAPGSTALGGQGAAHSADTQAGESKA